MSDESQERPTVQIGTDVDAVSVLSRAARAIGDERPLFVRFRDNSRLRARVVLGDWMGGTAERPWPDVEILDGEGSDRLNAIAEERWERIGELEEQIKELEEAIAAVGEALDRIDAPQGATYAERVDRLYRELTGRAPGYGRYYPKEKLEKITGFAVAQRDSHHTLREEDTNYAEYHRGAEYAYALVAERLGADSTVGEAAHMTRQAFGDGESRPEGKVPPGTRELRIVLEDVSDPDGPPEYRFIELEDQDGRGIGAFGMQPSTRPPFHEIAIPYGRDDAWVQEVVMRAINVGQEADVPFPPDAADAVLREFGCEPTLPRKWPARGEAFSPTATELPEADAEARSSDYEVLPDEFDCATEACKRLHERLTEGPTPNPAELARVIDILRHGVGR